MEFSDKQLFPTERYELPEIPRSMPIDFDLTPDASRESGRGSLCLGQSVHSHRS